MTLLKSSGVITVEKDRIAVNVSNDLVGLYSWFIRERYWVKLNTPLHGAHITIHNKTLEGIADYKKAKSYHGKWVMFEYDPDIIEGGYRKGFIMYYLVIYSPQIDMIKRDIGLVDKPYYRGLHLTIGNMGKSGSKPATYWPTLITI